MSKSLNRVKPQFLHVKWEKQWYLCHSRLVWGLNRVIHVPDTGSSLNGNGCCSKCHPHHCHLSSFYIHFQYHMEDSSWSERPGCNLVARQGNFSLFPFGSNHWHSAGEELWVTECTPESASAVCQTGWNSSLERPTQLHKNRSFKSLHPETNQWLPD